MINSDSTQNNFRDWKITLEKFSELEKTTNKTEGSRWAWQVRRLSATTTWDSLRADAGSGQPAHNGQAAAHVAGYSTLCDHAKHSSLPTYGIWGWCCSVSGYSECSSSSFPAKCRTTHSRTGQSVSYSDRLSPICSMLLSSVVSSKVEWSWENFSVNMSSAVVDIVISELFTH